MTFALLLTKTKKANEFVIRKLIMEKSEVINKIIDIVEKNAPDMFEGKLTGESVINTDGALDSMGFVYLIVKIEGEFGVKVPERKWSKLKTVGDVADAILLEMK
jgi:acyl carrier protein